MLSLAKNVGRRSHAKSRDERPLYAGPYRLCLELASGGMATVYLAYNGAAARFAAVKLVHPHLASDPGFAEMFADEAEIASRIRHPNVCGVYDFEVSEGQSYLAMEYLLGEPIAALWRKLSRTRGLDPRRNAQLAAKALADACEGLHAAHELTDADGEPLEIVHRDVSPGNIVVTFDGVTKMVDFGVAGAARKRHRTETGMLKGKLAYIAPESMRGRKADRRCDVWGIGVVAWELVTGRRLFRASSEVDTLRAVMDKPIPRPSEVRSELPEEIDDVIMRALERDPRRRYPSARELGRDLARIATSCDVITASDLGEWLEGLFPGAKERRLQLLDIAGQIARGEPEQEEEVEREPTPSTVHGISAPTVRTPGEQEMTRVYDRTEPAVASAPHRTRAHAWSVVVGIAAGVALGATAAWGIERYQGLHPEPTPSVTPRASASAPAAPPAPAPAPPAVDAEPLRSAARLTRGPYAIDIVDGAPDELLLRVRLEPPPALE